MINFFDINKFPKEKWLLVFPISMSRISSGQDVNFYIEQIKFFEKKCLKTGIWICFVYCDFLYLHDDTKASILKEKFMQSCTDHKNGIMKFIWKNIQYIPEACNFFTRNQLYLLCPKFIEYFWILKNLYTTDTVLQSCLEKDAKANKKRLTKNQLLFFLEEYLMTYLITKQQVRLYNEYIWDSAKWTLLAYPWRTSYTLSYLYQKNPFKLKAENIYQNTFYDLSTKKAIDNLLISLD